MRGPDPSSHIYQRFPIMGSPSDWASSGLLGRSIPSTTGCLVLTDDKREEFSTRLQYFFSKSALSLEVQRLVWAVDILIPTGLGIPCLRKWPRSGTLTWECRPPDRCTRPPS